MFPKQQAPKRNNVTLIAIAAATVSVLALAAVGYLAYARRSSSAPDSGKYQAVFLTNGQVYFGKLSGIGGRSPVLDDVFYLQVNQPLQQGTSGGAIAASGTPQVSPDQPKFSLMKLGQSEVHGPEDRLFLMKDQILFWENLREDSQVMKTIEDFRKQATN